MSIAYLTSRQGTINQLVVNQYVFKTKDRFKQFKAIDKIKLEKNYFIYEINHIKFQTFLPLNEEITSEYQLVERKILEPPFKNTIKISRFISHLLNEHLRTKFDQFLFQNTFIVDQISVYPFKVLKCIEYNVELFDDGNYYIHFKPVSKILIDDPSVDRLLALRMHMKGKESDKLILTFVKFNYQKERLDINLENFHDKIRAIFDEGKPINISVDYHFLSNYSTDVLREISKNTLKELKSTIWFVHSVLKEIQLPEAFGLSEELYLKTELIDFGEEKNLELGKSKGVEIVLISRNETRYGLRLEYYLVTNKDQVFVEFVNDPGLKVHFNKMDLNSICEVVIEKRENWKNQHITLAGNLINKSSQQSVSFYHGIFQPANNARILPLLIDIKDIDLFKSLIIEHFNKHSDNFGILNPLMFNVNDSSTFEEIKNIKQSTKEKFLLCVFTKFSLPLDFTKELRRLKIPYQIFQGEMKVPAGMNPILSNFACKCLEKLGGIVTAIKDSGVPEDTYYVGIDLGHSKINEDPKTNLGLAVFNSKGLLLAYHRETSINRNEALNNGDLRAGLYSLKKQMEMAGIDLPNQVVVHRDGKLHSRDIETILDCFKVIWEVWEVDILEIIKTGFPVMAMKENNTVINPASGSAFVDLRHKYGILATNTQIDEYGATIKPLVIKHKYGDSEFKDLLKGVYWLTKVYTNNLYFSTRLPATTLKANNIVSTSDKIHMPTFLG